MDSFFRQFGRNYLEAQGRNRPTPRYSFPDNEIVLPGGVVRVSTWWNAIYLNLHPTHYAVVIAPDGQTLNLRGGFNELPGGRYVLHYVDKQNRVARIPRVSETTLDGAQVSLELVITYRVAEPIKALEVQNPVNTLIVFIQSDLKEFIRSHKYDDIVGGADGRSVDSNLVARYIKEQHIGRHQMSKLFYLAEVVVEGKAGDPKLTEIRENFQAEQRQNVAKAELTEQNQNLARKVAAQEAEIQRIKAESEATQREIQQRMLRMGMELENARAALGYRQDTMHRAMDAIRQALSAQGYPRDPREIEVAKELLKLLGDIPGSGPDASTRTADDAGSGSGKTPNSEKIDSLTDTLLNLLNRKRS
jgi:regulator of protease activity HflC (stomatin/prohibitin superfamily)